MSIVQTVYLLHKGGLPLALWVSKFFWIKCLEISLTLAQNFGRVSAHFNCAALDEA